MKTRVFPALLKSWRHRRGLSQLDLAITAEMSPRHLSFLETGRSRPSPEMVLRLAAALDVPLREQNELLAAAEHPPHFPESDTASLPPAIDRVLARMCEQQEPYPLIVVDSAYDVVRTNRAGQALLSRFVKELDAIGHPLNLFDLTFDHRLSRPFIVDWEQAARDLLARLHREVLLHPGDPRRADLLARVLAMPDVPKLWRAPDFGRGQDPVLSIQLARDGVCLSFITVVTAFSSPHTVTLDELRIEAWFPGDDATAAFCAAIAATEA